MGQGKRGGKWVTVLLVLMVAVGTAWGAGPAWLPSFPLRAGDSILLMWLPVPGAQSYNVYRSEDGGEAKKQGATTTPTYTDPSTDKTRTVEYTIKAVVNGQEGEASAKGVIKGAEALKPPIFTGNRIVGGTKMAILWTPVPKAVFYNLYKSEKKGGEFKLITSSQDAQYVDADVKDGQTLYYQVSAVDLSSVESPRSEPLAVQVQLVQAEAKKKDALPLVVRKVKKAWRSRGEANFELSSARDVAVTKEGNLAAVSGREIQVIAPDGKYISRFAAPPSKDQEVAWGSPIGIGVAADGMFVVVFSNPTFIRTFAPDGTLVKEGTLNPVDPKTTTAGYVRAPIASDAEFASDGTIWVVENVNFQLLHLDRDLKEIGRVGKPIGLKTRKNEQELVVPTRIAIDRKSGKMFVTETMAARVTIFDKDGKRLGAFGQGGDDPGAMNIPTGVAITPAGEVLVGDSNLGRIQAFDQEGKYLATYHDAEKSDKDRPATLGAMTGVAVLGENLIIISEDARMVATAFERIK